jgi:hypothetical protein
MLLNVPGILCKTVVTGLVWLDPIRKMIKNVVYLIIFGLSTHIGDLNRF